MVKKLKEIIFGVVIAIGTVVIYNTINVNIFRWSIICIYTFIAIILTEVFLEEEPGELFNYFSIKNWKKARISSVLMVIETISVIATLVSIYNAIINR